MSTKRSIGTSLFQLAYGTNVVFLASLGIHVMKFLHNQDEENNSMHNIINHLIELQETREKVYHKSQIFQERMKNTFDKKIKKDDFQLQNLVLKWDARIEDKGKHGKFDHLWKCPYQIVAYNGKNAYTLHEVNGDLLKGVPANGRFLKHYHVQYKVSYFQHCIYPFYKFKI